MSQVLGNSGEMGVVDEVINLTIDLFQSLGEWSWNRVSGIPSGETRSKNAGM